MSTLDRTIARIVPQDRNVREQARKRLEQLTMPFWALGRLMDLAVDLAGITRSMRPNVEKRLVITMAGDHGVVSEGVSNYPQEVTGQMVRNFIGGGAGINAIARVAGSQVLVVDMGSVADLSDLSATTGFITKKICPGTANMAKGPAMTREDAVRSIEAGIEIALDAAKEVDLFGTGEMGIGNTTPSSAIVAAFTGRPPSEVTGRGTGIDETRFRHKVSIIEESLSVNRPDPRNAIDVLSKVGGFEIGGIAGVILGAASVGKPVLVDGFISTAGALVAYGLSPLSADYMIAAHRSVEQGHRAALDHLGKRPLLDLDLRLGEGTGAALAMTLVEAAVRILTEVATFEEAAVSGAEA